jgi:hypothetical protein
MTERVDWQFAVKVPGADWFRLDRGVEVVVAAEPQVFDDQGSADKMLRLVQDAHKRLGAACNAEIVARKVTTTIGEWEIHEDVG